MTLFEEFQWRGLVFDATGEAAEAVKNPLVVYAGFDPTATSLHVGSLVPLLQLRRCQLFGHTPIALVGGGTGMIGDPSGKSAERNLQTTDQISENLAGMAKQLREYLDFDAGRNSAQLVNNAEWLNTVTMVEFLRDIGKNFSVNVMMQKESVRRRLESEAGISYTEFTYSLMQAYDYLELFDRYKCTLQIGGSDQWGNITAGTDLIRRKRQGKAHAMVFPLLTTSTGQKFGKTEAGTVWLDAEMTSPYQFYQYWYNTDDRDVDRYLKTFTFLSRERIEELAQVTASSPEKRIAQTELAREVTKLVHGEEETERCVKMAQGFFASAKIDLSGESIVDFVRAPETKHIPYSFFDNDEIPVVRLITASGILQSNSEVRRKIDQKGLYICSGSSMGEPQVIEDQNRMISISKDASSNEKWSVFVFKLGKKNVYPIVIDKDK